MKYSVIIPIYNAEKTLRRCVDSLLAENYPEAEIILINDGSLDSSEMICREYAEACCNVRVLTQENAGVSAARNAGLDAACGEYVLFVDSDDYVVPDYFSTIDRMLETNKADMILLSFIIDNGAKKHLLSRKLCSDSSREELMPHIVDAICRKTINGPWAKLYKRELIEKHHIRFPAGVSVGEDMAFNIVYSFRINSYAQLDTAVYVLSTENKESLSRKRHADLQEQFKTSELYIGRELNSAGLPDAEKECYKQAIDYVNCTGIYHYAKLMVQDHVNRYERKKSLKKLCKEINSQRFRYPHTAFCELTTLPIRLYWTSIIDVVACKLARDTYD